MIIYVVKTFRGYWVTASEEEAELKANKLYDELKNDYEENRIVIEDLWTRIYIYEQKGEYWDSFVFRSSRWTNKM